MPIRINGLNTGSVTLSAPANGGDVTLNLPNANGTVATTSYADTAPGLQYITGQTFTAVSTVNVNNCFTSTYDNYRIIIDPSDASTSLVMSMRLRVSGADNSTSNYTRQNLSAQSTTVGASQTLNAAQWGMATTDATVFSLNRFVMDIFSPQATRITNAIMPISFVAAGPVYYSSIDAYIFNATTSFDGFSLITSTGNISGNLRVYGYRNS